MPGSPLGAVGAAAPPAVHLYHSLDYQVMPYLSIFFHFTMLGVFLLHNLHFLSTFLQLSFTLQTFAVRKAVSASVMFAN